MLDTIRDIYEIFEKLNISVTGLIVLALILSLAFLFSVREAASWFFKVDDLKRDMRRLREITLQLEGEMRVLQGLLGQAKQISLNVVPPLAANDDALSAPVPPQPSESPAKKPGSTFTIQH